MAVLRTSSITDFTGTANFNETFPLFNWYVVETDTTRYKTTGTHVVYDAGGPADGSASCGDGTNYPKCGGSNIGKFLANTFENNSVPANLRVPGAVYCANADCSTNSIQDGPGRARQPLPVYPPAASIRHGLKLKDSRASPARTTSSSLARHPTNLAKTAASRDTSCMPRLVLLTTR